jgi:predicted transcriptional regulator YdeE
MNYVKQMVIGSILKALTRKNLVTQPKVVELEEKACIGFKITTSLKGNRKKRDIPPFYHDVYDHDKLSVLRQGDDENMYCIFDFHENGQDFDYYVSVENKAGLSGEPYAEIRLPQGRYVQVEFLKRNHRAAAMIVGYTREVWIASNGYETRNSPLFILYDQRFHRNYKKHGCQGGTYLGDPLAVLHLPVN